MKKIQFILLLLCCLHGLQAQKQTGMKFILPKGATSQDYLAGKIAVKVKSEHRIDFANGRLPLSAGMRIELGVGEVTPFVNHQFLAQKQAARAKPFMIDMRDYFYLSYDKSQSIEVVINALYASGLFDLVEPCYVAKKTYMPNDANTEKQYYLNKIKAFDAWDIHKGDTNVVIAVVDDAVLLNHEDLAANIYKNYADPINGKDDDGDGYVDNFQGWDLAGQDSSNVVPDNDPSPKSGALSHGTSVAGCASGATNNGKGMAGVGFNCKIMPVKVAFENAPKSIPFGYEGVLYAALHHADVINCSWSGTFGSQIFQNVCTFAVVDMDAVLIAAAGNQNTDAPRYPAAYDHVVSVAATDAGDVRAYFSNYGTSVDIAAPGLAIYTTTITNDVSVANAYKLIDGTSFSSPITAGAAGLARSKYPNFSALQIGELLRVTADPAFYNVNDQAFQEQLGYGRLDIGRALSVQTSAIRMEDAILLSEKTGNIATAGDTATFVGSFLNYLWPSSPNTKVRITSQSAFLVVLQGEIGLGVLGMMEKKSNTAQPFRVAIRSSTPKNTLIKIKIAIEDPTKNYVDYQYFQFVANPNYLNITENEISTSISSNGRLGYGAAQQQNGIGFIYNDRNRLYEMALMLGTSPDKIANAARNTGSGTLDDDFQLEKEIVGSKPGILAGFEATGQFSDAKAGTSASNVGIAYTAMAWAENPYQQFVIVEYRITNRNTDTLRNYYAGLFADWDISQEGAKDFAKWNAQQQLGYVYSWDVADTAYAGIQTLTGTPTHYAISNDPAAPDAPFGLYDGFTDTEKWTALSSNNARAEAGSFTYKSSDISHVVGSGPYKIAPGQTIKVAFALHAADSWEQLVASTEGAKKMYNQVIPMPRPLANGVNACYDKDANISASGAQAYRWYYQQFGGEPFSENAAITVNQIKRDTTLYVAALGNGLESLRTPVLIKAKAIPAVAVSGSTNICDGASVAFLTTEAKSP